MRRLSVILAEEKNAVTAVKEHSAESDDVSTRVNEDTRKG